MTQVSRAVAATVDVVMPLSFFVSSVNCLVPESKYMNVFASMLPHITYTYGKRNFCRQPIFFARTAIF